MSKKTKVWLGAGILISILVVAVWYKVSSNSLVGATSINNYSSDNFGLSVDSKSINLSNEPREINRVNYKKNTKSTSPAFDNIDDAQSHLIIKTGKMSVVVDDVRDAIKKISNYALEKGGFVVSSDINKNDIALYGNIKIRIPATLFDDGFNEIKTYGDVTFQHIDGQDVTEEYVDLDAQIKNLRATENQFLEIMKKATQITDILSVQRELSRIRGDIDRIEGRMKFLRQSANLSTLTIRLSTDPDALPAWGKEGQWKPIGQIKEAFRSLISAFKIVVDLFIWIIIYIPFWLFITFVIWGFMKIFKKVFKGKNKKEKDSVNML